MRIGVCSDSVNNSTHPLEACFIWPNKGKWLLKILTGQKMAHKEKALRELIDAEIRADTRKLSSYEEFQRATADTTGKNAGRGESLRHFFDDRRKFLRNHPEISKAK